LAAIYAGSWFPVPQPPAPDGVAHICKEPGYGVPNYKADRLLTRQPGNLLNYAAPLTKCRLLLHRAYHKDAFIHHGTHQLITDETSYDAFFIGDIQSPDG
jgi:hypothetical protein